MYGCENDKEILYWPKIMSVDAKERKAMFWVARRPRDFEKFEQGLEPYTINICVLELRGV
jgi:hypothetical protein